MASLSCGVAPRMTPDQERMAEALAVERVHRARAPSYVAERIRALALAGDIAGVERWQAIAARLACLLATSRVALTLR